MEPKPAPAEPGTEPRAGPRADAAPWRRAIVVMGMHRSGTSALAGALARLGCDEPATPMASSVGNERGHYESRRIFELHAAILASADSAWTDWAPVPPGWFASPKGREFRARAAEVIEEEFGRSPLFVLKDPRICRLAPLWLGALEDVGVAPLVLHTHRDPLEVAASLQARSEIDRDIALLLWLRHVLDAEAATRDVPRTHTSYARLLSDWPAVMRGVEAAFDLSLPARIEGTGGARVREFLTGALRHHRAEAPDPTVPGWVGDARAVLDRWAERGEDDEGRDELDRVRAAFDAATPVFSPIANRWSVERRRLLDKRAKADGGDLARKLAEAEAHAAERDDLAERLARAEADGIPAELEKARAAAEDERARADGLAAELDRRLGELAEAARLVVAARRKARATRRDLTEKAGAAQQALAAERAHREEIEAERTALMRSTSWRLTGPLRAVARRATGR